MPAVPPYSSTTMARWARSRRISDSEESTVLLIGRNFTGRAIRPTGTESLGHAGAEQVPDVHEADHVVVGAGVDRQPRMRHARGDGGGLGHRGLRVQEHHLGARHQDLADLPFARVEDLADDLPLVLAERLGAGHQLAQFLLGHGLAADPRIAAEDRDDQVGRRGQQPDDRPGQRGDPVEQRRGQQRQPGRPLQPDPLGRELAEDQAEERDADRHHDERDRPRPARRQVLPDQPRLQQRRPASSAP